MLSEQAGDELFSRPRDHVEIRADGGVRIPAVSTAIAGDKAVRFGTLTIHGTVLGDPTDNGKRPIGHLVISGATATAYELISQIGGAVEELQFSTAPASTSTSRRASSEALASVDGSGLRRRGVRVWLIPVAVGRVPLWPCYMRRRARSRNFSNEW